MNKISMITSYEARAQIITIITAAIILIASLAWNDALTTILITLWPNHNSLIAKIIYAIIITLIAAYLIVYLRKFMLPEDNK
jgi:fructose-specific phosphotransferase system IIC component